MADCEIDDLSDLLTSEVPTEADEAEAQETSSSYAATNQTYLDVISRHIDTLKAPLRPINLKIHDNPELNYGEFIAHEMLVGFLTSEQQQKAGGGWQVTPSAYGISTAFVAVFDGGGNGPVVSFNAEYDRHLLTSCKHALVGIGHACGHNLITIASLSAALATKETMIKYKLPGKVVLFGTPAEEGGGGKIKLLERGAYRDQKIDVSIMAHPGKTRDAALVSTSALKDFQVEYFGKEAHAAAAPWEGINALDALIIAYNAISVLRQQTQPGDIIQGHITNGGAAPNIIHAYASGRFIVRANTKARLAQLKTKVDACFKGAAEATGATLKTTHLSCYDDHAPNHALARSYRHHRNRLGGDIPKPEVDVVAGRSQASTDQGNISHAYPSLHSGFAIESVDGPHSPGFAASARTVGAHRVALTTGKALAAVAVDVLTQSELLKEIKREFEEMRVRDRVPRDSS